MGFLKPETEQFTQRIFDEYELCEDCYYFIHNGEPDEPARGWNPSGLDGLILAAKSIDDCGNESDNEPYFSSYACDCCNALAGQRYLAVDVDSCEECTKYRWRLSAPGYLDCTDWSVADSLIEAVSDCLGMHGDSFDEPDLLALAALIDGFDDFLTGYLLALAFTAYRQDSEESDPYPAYGCAGGDLSDVLAASEVFEMLGEDQKLTVLHDCLGFMLAADGLLGDAYEQAGSDFHFTRNGHGTGFWDSWDQHGEKLTRIARDFGSLELWQFGESEWELIA